MKRAPTAAMSSAPLSALAVQALLAASSLAFCACVPKSQYDAKSQEFDSCHQEAEAAKQKLAQLQQQLSEEDKQIGDLKTALGMAQSQAQALTDDQKAQLEEAKRAMQEAQDRAKLLDDMQAKFKKLIDAGNLKVTTRHGRVVLQLKTDVLFDTGEAEVKPAGKQALAEVGAALKGVPGKRFQIAGHTDNAPISAATQKKYPTNWELSAARAISVVKLLTQDGVDPSNLSAGGYSLYDPVAANSSETEKAKNRRIEIVLVPNVADLVSPDKK